MHCNHRCYECHIPACPERVRQSIGPRIIPMFADPPEWSADKVYSPLTLVIHNGATYMSRRCVPANTALPDTDPFYNESWVMVYDMNAQVAQYREEVAQLSQQVTDFGTKVDSWEQMIVTWTALINNWQNEFPELSKDLSAITERVATLEPQVAQALVDISDIKEEQETQNTQIATNTQNIADLTPRVEAAETHLSALDDEQKVQDDHLNNLDASQLAQDAKIQANTDLATRNQQNINANTAQITENSNNIAKNAAEIATHAEQLEALNTSQSEQDTKIQDNTDSIAQLEADVAQVEATANQAKDSAAHAEAAAAEAQTTATEAKEAAEAASAGLTGQGDRITALETSQGQQDGRLDALEAGQTTQDDKISALETANSQQDTEIQGIKDAQTQQAADIAALKDGTTALPYIKNTGDTVSGAYNFTEAVLTVSEPSSPDDAVNKQYVDDAISASAGGITPDVTQLKSDVAALKESQTAQDTEIANLKSGATALPYIKNTGDTVTGDYDFTGGTLAVADPSLPVDAANKQYVDNAVKSATDPELTYRVETLETSQAQQDAEIENITNGTTPLPYLSDSGDTSSGAYNFTGAVTVPVPASAAQATNKQYVDGAINTAVDGVRQDVGLKGPTGHMVFVDTIKLPAASSKTLTREADTDYMMQVYLPSSAGAASNLAVVAGDNTAQTVQDVTVTPSASDFSFSAGGSGYTAFVTVYKYIADGDQPQPDPSLAFETLNPPVVLSATSANPQTGSGDLTATLNAMIAAQPNWFKYKMQNQDGSTTYYVMSASEIQPTATSAANVLYCTTAGTWYQGETINFKINFTDENVNKISLISNPSDNYQVFYGGDGTWEDPTGRGILDDEFQKFAAEHNGEYNYIYKIATNTEYIYVLSKNGIQEYVNTMNPSLNRQVDAVGNRVYAYTTKFLASSGYYPGYYVQNTVTFGV